jgi:hypothetical protein
MALNSVQRARQYSTAVNFAVRILHRNKSVVHGLVELKLELQSGCLAHVVPPAVELGTVGTAVARETEATRRAGGLNPLV